MTIANVPMPRLPSTGCGFSLFEIMITLAVASVLMTVAVPYLGGFVRDVRLKSVGNAFIGDMHFARSEAVKRNARITLRPTSNPDTDLCANAAPGDWSDGWLMCEDQTLIRRGAVATSGVTIISNEISSSAFEYNSDGSTNEEGATARFAICDARGGAYGYQINVPPVGRPVFEAGDSDTPVECTAPI